MPSITGYAGTGTLLKFGNAASPEVFTTVSNIKELNGIKQTRTRLDSSTHNYAATQSGYDDFILGLKKGGSYNVKLVWDPNDATHGNAALAVRGLYEAGTKINMKVLLGNVSPVCSLTHVGAISELGVEYPLDGLLMMDAKIEIAGAVTQNASA